MRGYFNNKGKIILSVIFIVFCSTLLALCFILPDSASSGPYIISAHGSSSYGVKRSATGFPIDYARGNCAHCHEQHASIDGSEPDPIGGPDKYALMSKNFNTSKTIKPYLQSDSVCFYCHIVTDTYQSPVFNNYTYSITFGGYDSYTVDVDDNIFGTFNNTSYHNLNDILNFAKGTSGWSTFTANSNPCSACHNVHIAKRSCGKPTDSYDPTKSAISRPSDHSNLWGDDASERLKLNFTSSYQAPYWYDSTTFFEPYSTNTTTDGSNLPDYVTFCTDCHNATNTIPSTVLGTLKKIDWVTTGGDPPATLGGDKHGINSATVGINVDPPYSTSNYSTSVGFVLACTDCHEPHGAPNVMLIRKEVNGAVLSTISTLTPVDCTEKYSAGNKYLGYLCNRCHRDDADAGVGTANKWYYVHHQSTDRPYSPSSCDTCHSTGSGMGAGSSRNAIDCNCCHFHGSTDAAAPDSQETGRRTF